MSAYGSTVRKRGAEILFFGKGGHLLCGKTALIDGCAAAKVQAETGDATFSQKGRCREKTVPPAVVSVAEKDERHFFVGVGAEERSLRHSPVMGDAVCFLCIGHYFSSLHKTVRRLFCRILRPFLCKSC